MKELTEQRIDVEDFRDIIQNIQAIYKQAVIVYRQRVDTVIRNKNTSQGDIEHLFDGMLDFCDNAEMLLQYKRLCRHYFYIYPKTVGYYINAYRECWDSESDLE
jgi:hypothetical protein